MLLQEDCERSEHTLGRRVVRVKDFCRGIDNLML